MKKLLISLLVVTSVALFNHVSDAFGQTTHKKIVRSEKVDCPGLFTGDRYICHVNGPGVGCSLEIQHYAVMIMSNN